jgi:hypothetical protein
MYGDAPNSTLLQTFFEKTQMHDEYRNESFKDTFPEVHTLLDKFKGQQ